jgi:hypothetical protein
MELLVKPEILRSYVYGPMFGNAESCLIFAAHWISAESFTVLQLCVSTLPATKNTLIKDGI